MIKSIITTILVLSFCRGSVFAEGNKVAVLEDVVEKVASQLEEADETISKSVAVQVVKEVGNATVGVINTSGEKVSQIIEKCGPVLTTMVEETGQKYRIKTIGCFVVTGSLVLTIVLCVILCFRITNKFDGSDDDKAIIKMVIGIIAGIIMFITLSIGVYHCFSNWSKAVSPTRTMFVEAVEASK